MGYALRKRWRVYISALQRGTAHHAGALVQVKPRPLSEHLRSSVNDLSRSRCHIRSCAYAVFHLVNRLDSGFRECD